MNLVSKISIVSLFSFKIISEKKKAVKLASTNLFRKNSGSYTIVKITYFSVLFGKYFVGFQFMQLARGRDGEDFIGLNL